MQQTQSILQLQLFVNEMQRGAGAASSQRHFVSHRAETTQIPQSPVSVV